MPLVRRRRIRPVSEKRAAREAAERARAAAESPAFRQAVHGLPCASCGRTSSEAWRETGVGGHEAHHAVRAQTLERLGRGDLLWHPRLAVALCVTPCHHRHTTRHQRLPLEQVPADVVEFCLEEGLYEELEKECGGA